MAINVGTAVGYLELDTSRFQNGFTTARRQLQGFTDTTSSMGNRITSLGNGLKTIGSNLSKYVTVPLLGVGVGASKAAIDFESAFAGVKKTVDATDKELSKLEQGIRDMAKEMPTAATEIAGVAEAAGQLGIEVPNIMSFTKTMVMLGDSTNMSAEEAATSLARLANITGMSQTDFDKLGSTIVALGNNLATTESEITAMGLRLAGAGAQVGMSEAQIMSFAGALSSVGIQAEAGGSAFSKVMVNMQLATETGGKSLEKFASVAGMSANEFKTAFQKDATGAIISFIKGLGNAESQGKTAIGILDDMGIKEVVLRDTLLRAAGASDVFTDAIEIGTNAWDENTALTNEASQRYETMQSKISILKNKFIDIGITIGNVLMPHLEKLVNWLGKVADWFSKLDESTQGTIIAIAGVLAAIGPVLIIIGQMSIGIGALIKAFTLFTTFMRAQLITHLVSFYMLLTTTIIPTLTATAVTIGAVTIPVWAVIGAIVALIAIGVLLYKNWDTIKAKCSEVWQAICDNVEESYNKIKQWFSDMGEAIGTFFSELPGKVSTWLSVTKNNITTWCSDTFNTFITWCSDVINGISTWFSELPYKLGYILGYALGTIVSWGVGVYQYLTTNVPLWIEAISTFFSELPGKIKTWLVNTFNNIVSWGQNVFNKAVEIGTNFVNNIIKFFTELPGKVSSCLTNTYNKVINWASQMINKAIQTGTQFINNIITFFSQLPGKIATWLTNTISKVASFVTQMSSKAREAATQFTNNLVNGVKSIPGKMQTIGANIVQGLWNGIQSMVGWIKNKISGFVSGIIDGFKGTQKSVASAVSSSRMLEIPDIEQKINVLGEVDYSKARFDYASARQTTVSDIMASNYSMLDKIKDLSIDTKSNVKDTNTKTDNNVIINLNIEKFINETEQSVDDLMDEIAFKLKRKTIF